MPCKDAEPPKVEPRPRPTQSDEGVGVGVGGADLLGNGMIKYNNYITSL